MKSLKDLEVANKRVLVRVDFNVSRDLNGKIGDPFRIEAVKPTLQYLLERKAKIILISHWDKPAKRDVEWSLIYLKPYLEKVLNQKVKFIPQVIGPVVQWEVERLKSGEILLLENLRFEPGEIKNDPEFAKKLADLGEIFVQDAFGAIHREHASIVSLPKILLNATGFLLEKEIAALKKVQAEPIGRPLTVIMGGVKVGSKIRFIHYFLQKADNLILGGALANTVLLAKGLAIGKSFINGIENQEIKNLEITSQKLHLPIDIVTSSDTTGAKEVKIMAVGNIPADELILDIGPDSREIFSKIIKQSKTIIWNGPFGLFEVDKFSKGTKALALAIAQSSAYSVVGGGETAALLHQMNIFDKISHVSTGGGSMLDFLSGEELPGLVALN